MPLLILSIASLAGHIELAPGFAWIGTYPALLAFAAATLVEILAYFFPYVDNLLSSISAPAAVIAGIVITASVFFGMGPFVTWVVAVIAGGGSALAGRSASTAAHAGSTAVSGGSANPAVTFIETIFTAVLAVISVLAPVLVIAFLALFAYAGVKLYRRLRGRRRKVSAALK